MTAYLDIGVAVSPGPDGAYTVRVESAEGGQGNATLHLPFDLAALAGTVFGVDQTVRAIGSVAPQPAAAPADTRTAADFGAALFEALFQGTARDVLMQTESVARARADAGVRIRLTMDLAAPGMAAVASLPWELMCRKGMAPLVVSIQTPLVRSLDTPRPIDPKPFRPPLRVMALMSNPSGSPPLDLAAERDRIGQSWAKLPGVQVDFVRPVQADVLARLAADDYHVVHYMGHGDFAADSGGLLLMENADGSPRPVNGDAFAVWLADEPLRLVFLNACRTGTTGMRSGLHPFAGVATALIRNGVPAVVAMQFPISDGAAIAFAQTFYERVAAGFPVDAAVGEGRKALYSNVADGDAEWATPVLYLRARDGVLFAVPESEPVPPAATGDPWDIAPTDAFRIFLATPDQDVASRHRQLGKALRAEGVIVADTVPQDDQKEYAAAVDRLVRRADLCVHLLGAKPGQRLDWGDPADPLATFPLDQLRVGLDAARAQLVILTPEDKVGIDDAPYAAKLDELVAMPREKARFELQIIDRLRIAQAVLDKRTALIAARQAPVVTAVPAGSRRAAFVDAFVVDGDAAVDLCAYLEGHDITTTVKTSSAAPGALADLDTALKGVSLYVVVAGSVDPAWVSSRKVAVMKSVVRSRAPLLIGRYAPPPAPAEPATAQLDLSALNDSDPRWIAGLFGGGGAA